LKTKPPLNYKALVDQARVGVYQTTINGEFLYVNQEFLNLFEYETLEDLQKIKAADLYKNPDQRQKLVVLIKQHGKTSNYEVELQTKSGVSIWALLDATLDGDTLSGMVIDITARHKAEQEVKKSERWFRSIWENSKDGMRLLNSDGIIIDVNDAYCRLVEHKRDELIGKPFTRIYDRSAMDTVSMMEKFHHEFQSGESDEPRESNITLANQKSMYLQVTHSMIEVGDQTVMLSIFRDMTEHNRIEEKLGLRSTALKAAANGIIITDKSGVIQWVNPSVCRLTGYSMEELIGETPNILKSGTQSDDFYQQMWETIISGEVWHGELVNKRKDGSLYTEEMTITPVTDNSGSITQFIAIKHDISHRKQAEKALRDSERNLRQLIENMQEGIFRVTENGEVSFVNQQLADIFGIQSPESLIGLNVYDVNHPTITLVKNLLQKLKTEGHLRNYQISMENPNGGEVHVQVNAVIIRDEDDDLLYYEGTVDDITEQKALESQLLHAQKMEALGHIAGGIAHDFNNVMAAISGANQMLVLKAKNQEFTKYTDLIKSNIERGRSVTERMLTFTRSHKPQMNTISLSELLYTVHDILSHTLPKRIEITIQPFKGIGLIEADRGQLQQVLLNLCINASDAMPSGGTIALNIDRAYTDQIRKLPLNKERDYLCVTVKDNGSGISGENLDNIFEPFFTTKEPGKGTGLGLSVVYKIIKNHDGLIDVQSEPGVGTTFYIYLPVSNKNTTADATVKTGNGLQGTGQRILLVEDEENIRSLLSEWLKTQGFLITIAKDAREALALLANGSAQFDILLTDIGLPGMSGVELARRVKEKLPQIKMIASTGYVDESEQNRLKEVGFEDVVRKPFDFQQLLQSLNKSLV